MAGSAWTNQVVNLLIVGSGSPGTGVFVYSGIPAAGNGPIFWATSATSDPFGNPVTPTAGVAATGQFSAGFTIINQSGTFIYSSAPALGNLVASFAPASGSDIFGNSFLAGAAVYSTTGLTAQLAAGILAIANNTDTWTLAPLDSATDELDLTCLNGTLVTSWAPSLMTVTGGPLNADSVLSYGQASGGTVSVTFTSSGTFTVPAGVTTLQIQAWAGGGGGASSAGSGGGGGEYAAENASAATPGGTVTVTVGGGGALGVGGASNNGGSGGNTTTTGGGTTAVTAHGGGGGRAAGTPGGTAGSGSTNSVHHNGGTGGTSASSSKGGGGGGGGGGTTGSGGNGGNSSGNTPGGGGAAGSGAGVGSGGGWGAALGKIPTNGGTGAPPGGGGGAGGWDGGAEQAAGGAGARGKVIITYTPPATGIIAALAGVASTDAGGNAFAAGFTGQIQAFTPGASPQTVETWHAMGAFNTNFSHGTPAPAYKVNGDNTVSLAGVVVVNSGTTSGTVFTLPTGYRPITAKTVPVAISAGTPAATASARLGIGVSGDLNFASGATGAGYSFFLDGIRFPLDY
jgi:hypothetical protein